jgi:hypothetical protein
MSDAKLGWAIPMDVYDKEGNLTHIAFSDAKGEHILDAVWSEDEEQTSENRIEFRKWAYKMIGQQGWEILK